MRRIKKTTGLGALGNYDPDTYERLSFSAAVPKFLEGTDTPRAFLERCLETIHAREPEVRAFAYYDEEIARQAADASTERYKAGKPLSPIDGCPVALKDTIETVDMPMQQGSALYRGWTSNRDAACAWALRREGAALVGKTHVPEYAMGKSPPTRNPFDVRRSPGGSSSGSGACIGARMVPVAIGNQTMASLIRPSSYNANYGYKPTWGALNIGGMHPIAPSQDHIGPMAGTLADMWLAAQRISYIAGGHHGHPGLSGGPELPGARKPKTLVWLRPLGWEDLDDASLSAFEDFLAQLKDIGIEIRDGQDPAVVDLEAVVRRSDEIGTDICFYEARWPYCAYIDAWGRDLAIGETGYARLSRGIEMTPEDYRKALAEREAFRAKVNAVAEGTDGFITLASTGPAPMDRLGNTAQGTGDKPKAHLETGSRSFVSPWTLVGGPSLALPWLAVDQMPLGIQLMGPKDSDEALVGVARWIDEQMA